MIPTTTATGTVYHPRIRIIKFAIELETFVRDVTEITDAAFRIRLLQAFEHARSFMVGNGSKLFTALGEKCGFPATTIRDWSHGKNLPTKQLQRRIVLQELSSYLNTRYR